MVGLDDTLLEFRKHHTPRRPAVSIQLRWVVEGWEGVDDGGQCWDGWATICVGGGDCQIWLYFTYIERVLVYKERCRSGVPSRFWIFFIEQIEKVFLLTLTFSLFFPFFEKKPIHHLLLTVLYSYDKSKDIQYSMRGPQDKCWNTQKVRSACTGQYGVQTRTKILCSMLGRKSHGTSCVQELYDLTEFPRSLGC